jgi:proteic killer suppression protein
VVAPKSKPVSPSSVHQRPNNQDPILRRHRAVVPRGAEPAFHVVARVALRKLMQMNRAGRLTDLAVPPGNRLEVLRGDSAGLHSIRINDQWRIVFRWTECGPAEVRIMDYQ